MNKQDTLNAKRTIYTMHLVSRAKFRDLFIADLLPEVVKTLQTETLAYYIQDDNFIEILTYAGFTVNEFIEMVENPTALPKITFIGKLKAIFFF
jgi:hypothetical protein